MFFHWTSENKVLRPDMLFWENSASFDPEALTAALGGEFLHVYAEMSPDILGWPASRPRTFGVSLLAATVGFSGSAEEFLSWFMRSPQLDADIFFQAPEKDVQDMMRGLAAARGYAGVESPTLNMAVSPSAVVALENYKKLQDNRAGINSGAFVCDLDQNPGFSACGSFLPSCPTHSSIYSMKKGRLMCGQELLVAMGACVAMESDVFIFIGSMSRPPHNLGPLSRV